METNPANGGAPKPQPLSVPTVVMLVAAFVGFVAVYYHWFSSTLPIPPSAGGTLTTYRKGFADVSGTFAVVSAGAAFAGAALAMILSGEGSRRVGILIGLLGGVALVASCILGFVHAGDVAHTGKAAIGLYVSLVSGLAVVGAGAVALRELQASSTPPS